MELMDALSLLPRNETVVNNFIKAYGFINSPTYKKILCTISGGSDSDIVLDICTLCDTDKKIEYVWFDTGLEYQATKEHLKFLEDKYGVEIKQYKAKQSIPTTCKSVGLPFLSKFASDMIGRLQSHGFEWEDQPLNILMQKYQNCTAALRWWCNDWGHGSMFNISRNKGLKEFMMENPPLFKISDKCCKYAKKDVLHSCMIEGQYDLNVYGVRRAEGGKRASTYKSCFDSNCGNADEYRPIFFYKDADKREYEQDRNITHSDCYSVYGLKRTGCAGCPFGRDFEGELECLKAHEPKLFKAVNNIFGESYEYTRQYRAFKAKCIGKGVNEAES